MDGEERAAVVDMVLAVAAAEAFGVATAVLVPSEFSRA